MPDFVASLHDPPAPPARVALRNPDTGATVAGVRYLLTEDESGVLGRDILNHVTLLLDGPRHRWSEQVP